MRRLVTILALLALAAPAPVAARQAEPEVGPGTFGVGPWVTCHAGQGYPYAEVAGQPFRLYLSSNFVIDCQPIDSRYSIDRYEVGFRHGVLINGSWGPYSNEESRKTLFGAGLIGFLPSRDLCDTGGAQRRYRGRSVVDVWVRSSMGGFPRHDSRIVVLAGPDTIGCGNNEPG